MLAGKMWVDVKIEAFGIHLHASRARNATTV
jgi:hypothetical protein